MADAVTIKIRADAKQAKREMKGLGRGFTDLGSSAKKASADLFLVTAAVAAVVAAAVAAAAAFVNNARDVALLGDEIAKTARIVGVSAEQFQVLRFAAERSGVAMSSVTNGLKRLSRSMFDAQNGSKLTRDTFEGMGIAIEDANGNLRDSEDVFRDIADRIQTVGVNTQTTAELMTVLGRSGADLTNILMGGSEALDDFKTQAKSLGGIMDGQLLAASEAYQNSMADMDLATQGLKNELALGLIPVLTFLADIMANRVLPNIRRMVREFGEFKLPGWLKTILRTLPGGALVDIAGMASTIAGGLAGEGTGDSGGFDPDAEAAALMGAFGPDGGGGGGGKTAPTEENYPALFALVEATQTADEMITTNKIAALADRLFWERFHQANIKEMHDQAEREADERAARAIDLARLTAQSQEAAAFASLAAIETFAGLAQSAVEDSYFGQTKAGKTAAKVLFLVGKAAALASAIVNMQLAISNAMANIMAPANIGFAVASGIAGAANIAVIAATTIQGIADAGLPPGALRAAGLNQHTALAVRNDEMVLDPKGTQEITQMLAFQRRQMELSQGSASSRPIVVVAELDGQRLTRGLSPHMTQALEDGNDFRRNVRVAGAA
jgi:hypothetical protein